MATVPITFFMAVPDNMLQTWRELQPDAQAPLLVRGEDYWIALTYARLRDAGMPVTLDNRLPAEGVVVFYAGDKRAVWRAIGRDHRVLLVSTRSDRHPVGFADLEVVQNATSADGRKAWHIPHWPQPGLLVRDAARLENIRVVLFPGAPQNLHEGFSASPWLQFLAERQIEFRCHYTTASDSPPAWHDHRDVDVMLAIRPQAMGLVPHKPAWKLFNAWLAGVPAILGPEAGYRELRQSPLDYLEASNPDEAMTAIRRLLEEPGLYAAMIRNGHARGQSFSTESTVARWQQLHEDVLQPRWQTIMRNPPSRLRRWQWDLFERMRRLKSVRP